MPHYQSDLVEIRYTKHKGRGVFARRDIRKGTIIERVPVIVVTWEQIEDSELASYAYSWTDTKAAIALGYGSLYNHSFKPNAYYQDEGRQTKVYTAVRNITAGEEITINYNGDPKDKTNVLDFEILD
ncbi:SET domain-containing protein [Planctomicrobium sp. SH664]|uniref:SET domain-containing protein n=1 Tax=Planctomicrobium sp. SH664 TaxID=3448125 RepID=UPI003F5C979B